MSLTLSNLNQIFISRQRYTLMLLDDSILRADASLIDLLVHRRVVDARADTVALIDVR